MTNRFRMRSLATAANGITLIRIFLVVPLLLALGNGWMAGAMLLMAIAAVTGASFLLFAQVWAASGRVPGGKAGKYVGAVVMGTILLQLVC